MTQHKRVLAVVVTAVCSVSFALFAQADVIVHESFTYTPGGDLNGQGPGDVGFTGTWSGSIDYDLASGSLSYPSSSTLFATGNKAAFSPSSTGERITQTMSAATIDFDTDGVYYLSFLVNKTDGGTGSDYFWLQLEGSGSQKGAFGLASSEVLMAQAGSGYSPGFGTAIPLGQDVLLVGKIVTSASGLDQFMLSQFASSATVPFADPGSWAATDTAAVTGTINTLVLRKGTNASMRLDEIRVGTTWADVTHVPEPSTLMICLGTLAGLAWRRRRRTRI